MKNKGFIKIYRSMLSKPEMTDLVNEQGAVGFGVYMMIVLYLAQCDDFEGMFTNGQLSAFAARPKLPVRMCAISSKISACSRYVETDLKP